MALPQVGLGDYRNNNPAVVRDLKKRKECFERIADPAKVAAGKAAAAQEDGQKRLLKAAHTAAANRAAQSRSLQDAVDKLYGMIREYDVTLMESVPPELVTPRDT